MCPVCLTNAALIAAGATSSDGLTALMMSKFCRKKTNQPRGKQNETKRDGTRNGSERTESLQNRVTSGWPEHACIGCSIVADQVAHLAHLNARDTTLAFVSRAPQTDIERVKARMGWEMPWYTITDDFDTDFGVDEWQGTNAFIRDGGSVFRTYFINNRGDEAMGGTWSYLDLTALGRQEEWENSPEGYPQTPP